MALLLARLRAAPSPLRPRAAAAAAATAKANFFWSTPEAPAASSSSSSVGGSGAEDAAADSLTTTSLVRQVAETHELSQAEARRILTTVFDTIKEAVADKRAVRIANFGSFYAATSKATTGRNPRTGEAIAIPAKERVRFRAYDEFKRTVAEA